MFSIGLFPILGEWCPFGEGVRAVAVERKPGPIPVLMGVERDAKPKNPVLHLKRWGPFLQRILGGWPA